MVKKNGFCTDNLFCLIIRIYVTQITKFKNIIKIDWRINQENELNQKHTYNQ